MLRDITMRNRSEALQCLYVAGTRPRSYLIFGRPNYEFKIID